MNTDYTEGKGPVVFQDVVHGAASVASRVLDVVAAGMGIVVLAPVFALIAVAVVLDDGLPALFRQRRVGQGGKLFRLFKFRSMVVGRPGNQITSANDSRVTRVGKFLRRYKLDELPQLWNVLRGEMSLIGPRPEVMAFVYPTDLRWRAVLGAKPGITDLASLVYRNEEQLLEGKSDPEKYYRDVILSAKLELNLEYLRRRTFWSDLKLIWWTVRYSFWPGGFVAGKIKEELRIEKM